MDEGKKRLLESYLMLERMKESVKKKIDAMRLDKTCPSVINDGMPHAHGGGDLSDYIARKEPYENRLIDIKTAQIAIGREIIRSAKEASKDWELVQMRYIKGMGWKEIAKEKGIKKSDYYNRISEVTGKMILDWRLIYGWLQFISGGDR